MYIVVSVLVVALGADDFRTREAATSALITLNADVPAHGTSPEQTVRLQRVHAAWVRRVHRLVQSWGLPPCYSTMWWSPQTGHSLNVYGHTVRPLTLLFSGASSTRATDIGGPEGWDVDSRWRFVSYEAAVNAILNGADVAVVHRLYERLRRADEALYNCRDSY